MSSLTLIRHGQASYGAADYDVLSPRGVEQSSRLGRHLAARGEPIDAVYSGPLRRQLDTARHLAEAAASAGARLPEVRVIPELDEFPAFELLRAHIPRLAAEDAALAAALGSPDAATRQGALDGVFEVVCRSWWRGELDCGELETVTAFRARVLRGLQEVMAQEGRGRRSLCVTSGGPISVVVQESLGLGDDATLRIIMVIANASATELRWRGDQLVVHGFNHTHHLEPELVTYR